MNTIYIHIRIFILHFHIIYTIWGQIIHMTEDCYVFWQQEYWKTFLVFSLKSLRFHCLYQLTFIKKRWHLSSRSSFSVLLHNDQQLGPATFLATPLLNLPNNVFITANSLLIPITIFTVLIYSRGNKKKPTNNKPVSLICVADKLCKTVIKDREVNYQDELNVFTEFQFGFMGGRSCITNLLSFYSGAIWKEMDGWTISTWT